jgi:hypothetical protein
MGTPAGMAFVTFRSKVTGSSNSQKLVTNYFIIILNHECCKEFTQKDKSIFLQLITQPFVTDEVNVTSEECDGFQYPLYMEIRSMSTEIRQRA